MIRNMSITRSAFALHYWVRINFISDVLFIAHRCKYICKIAFVDAAATVCRGLRYEKFVKGIRGYVIRGSLAYVGRERVLSSPVKRLTLHSLQRSSEYLIRISVKLRPIQHLTRETPNVTIARFVNQQRRIIRR